MSRFFEKLVKRNKARFIYFATNQTRGFAENESQSYRVNVGSAMRQSSKALGQQLFADGQQKEMMQQAVAHQWGEVAERDRADEVPDERLATGSSPDRVFMGATSGTSPRRGARRVPVSRLSARST